MTLANNDCIRMRGYNTHAFDFMVITHVLPQISMNFVLSRFASCCTKIETNF